MKWLSLALLAMVLAGCSSGVVPVGPQTYLVSKSVTGFSSGSAAKAQLYREADAWCRQRGLVMVPVSVDAQEPIAGRRMGTAELTFRALPPGDAEIKRPAIDKPDSIHRVQYR